jgi:hypothetical protein
MAAVSLLAFLARAAARARERKSSSDFSAMPLVVTTILLLAYSLLEHGPSDRVLVTPLMAVWASWGVVSLTRLPRWSFRLRRLPWLAGVAAAAVALLSVSGHPLPARVDISLATQASTARALVEALPPGVTVSFLGDLWPAALADIPLGSRFFHLGPKMNRAAGGERGGVLRGILRDRPDLILVARPRGRPLERLERALAGTGYRYAGIGNGFRVWRRKGAVARSASMSALNVLGPPTAGEVARGRGRVAP